MHRSATSSSKEHTKQKVWRRKILYASRHGEQTASPQIKSDFSRRTSKSVPINNSNIRQDSMIVEKAKEEEEENGEKKAFKMLCVVQQSITEQFSKTDPDAVTRSVAHNLILLTGTTPDACWYVSPQTSMVTGSDYTTNHDTGMTSRSDNQSALLHANKGNNNNNNSNSMRHDQTAPTLSLVANTVWKFLFVNDESDNEEQEKEREESEASDDNNQEKNKRMAPRLEVNYAQEHVPGGITLGAWLAAIGAEFERNRADAAISHDALNVMLQAIGCVWGLYGVPLKNGRRPFCLDKLNLDTDLVITVNHAEPLLIYDVAGMVYPLINSNKLLKMQDYMAAARSFVRFTRENNNSNDNGNGNSWDEIAAAKKQYYCRPPIDVTLAIINWFIQRCMPIRKVLPTRVTKTINDISLRRQQQQARAATRVMRSKESGSVPLIEDIDKGDTQVIREIVFEILRKSDTTLREHLTVSRDDSMRQTNLLSSEEDQEHHYLYYDSNPNDTRLSFSIDQPSLPIWRQILSVVFPL